VNTLVRLELTAAERAVIACVGARPVGELDILLERMLGRGSKHSKDVAGGRCSGTLPNGDRRPVAHTEVWWGQKEASDGTGVRHAVFTPPCRQTVMQNVSSRAAFSYPWLRLPRLLLRQIVPKTIVGARAGERERQPVACHKLRMRSRRGGGQRLLFSVADGIKLRLGRGAPRPALPQRARREVRIGIRDVRLPIPKRMGVGLEWQTEREGDRAPVSSE